MEYALYTCRFVQFASAIVLFGSSAFRFYALGGGAARTGSVTAFDRWLRRVTLVSAILALASALTLLLCQSAVMAGAPTAALDPATVSAVLFETRFGRVWSWHVLIAAILVAACFRQPARRQKIVLILSLLLLASLAWIGHAAMAEGFAGIGHEFNQTAHLLAGGLWLGGLLPLGWFLRHAQARHDEPGFALTRDAIRHFSQMGYVTVAVVGLTGAINSLLLVGSLGAFVETPYGRLLTLKILLFLTMVIVALVNRFHLAPRVCRDPAAIDALWRAVYLEQGLGLCILVVVSILGTWPPAIYGGGH